MLFKSREFVRLLKSKNFNTKIHVFVGSTQQLINHNTVQLDTVVWCTLLITSLVFHIRLVDGKIKPKVPTAFPALRCEFGRLNLSSHD